MSFSNPPHSTHHPPTQLKAFLTTVPHYTLKHPPDTPIRSLLSTAATAFPPAELSAELERLSFHWIDNVPTT